MKQISRLVFIVTLFLLYGPNLHAQSSGGISGDVVRVDRIEIQGNQLVDSQALFSQISLAPGLIPREQITSQVKNLFDTGFFDQVYAKVEPGNTLVFLCTEKPLVRKIYIEGNDEVDEKDLSKVFTFEGRRFLDKAKVQLLIRQGKAYYQSKGYYNAELSYSIVPLADNQVDVTFTVDEGERFTINEVVFHGLDNLDEDDLRDAIQTKPYSWWKSWLVGTGRLNEEMLNNDRLILRQYFLDNGYLDATISEPAIEVGDEELTISFEVTEGPIYQVGDISVDGDLIDGSSEETLDGIELEEGETFKANVMREDVFRITEKFTDIGYGFANVSPRTRIDPTTQSVSVSFNVDKGNEVSVRNVNIRGNTKTYDNVIRREVRIAEGDKYSSSKVRRSENLLQRRGYFEEVNISTDPVEGSDDEVDLNVNVREASTGTFSAGAGFSSSEGALFNARLSENNVLGTGRRLSLNADLGDERENFVLSLNDRRFNDSFWSVGLEALSTDREFTDFDREMQGGSLTVGYPLEEFFDEWAQDINFSLRYQYLDIEISNVDEEDAADLVIESEGSSSASGLTPRLTRNTINNPLNPTSGSRQSLSFEIAGLGGSEDYYLFEALNQVYTPIYSFDEARKVVFSIRTRFGYGESNDDDPFPLFRRFFPGGINSVRGYESRTLGPKDSRGNEFGGSKQLINNVEFIFPLVQSAGLQGVVFYDVGEAFDDDDSIELGELRQAYGYGLRWASPLGPIRIEFGIPIDREEGEDSFVTLFSFGAPL